MPTVYETIVRLCDERGITPGKMCNDLGMSRSTMTELKKGRSQTLKLEKASKIASYLNVPIEVLTGEQQKSPQPEAEGESFSNQFFAAYGKQNEEFTEKQIEDIAKYAKWIKEQEGSE